MHVTEVHILNQASNMSQTCSMTSSAQYIWARKYHGLWEKLEKNTKDSFCTALWKWLVVTENTDVVIAVAV